MALLARLLLAFPLVARLAESESTVPPWFWILLILILVALPIVVLLWGPRFAKTYPRPEPDAAAGPAGAEAHHAPGHAAEAGGVLPAEEPVARVAAVPASAEPDDLKIVEGIGPKIASVLQAAGISTFAQLAAADVARLNEILAGDRRLGLADPTTWPEQARLAAAGDWAGLEALQNSLKGGRQA